MNLETDSTLMPRNKSFFPPFRLMALILIIALFGLALGSLLNQSPTFDEGFYVVRGWAFLRTGRLLTLGHPALTNLWNGWPLLFEPDLPDPTTLDGWDEGNAERVSRDLLWERGLNVERVMFLARLPTLWLTLALGALLWRWANEMYGPWGATLTLTLFAFSPNLAAHAGLATTDLGVAAFYIGTLYAWTHFLRRPTSRWLVGTGILLGMALAAKFSALVLLPTLFVLLAWRIWRKGELDLNWRGWPRGRLASGALALIIVGVLALVTLWAIHGLNLGVIWGEFQHFLSLASTGHRAYLFGRFSTTGWWYYHLVVFVIKTPLPMLLLLAGAFTLAALHGLRPGEGEILTAIVLFLAVAMTVSLNVGYRYLLPVLPLIHLFIGRLAGPQMRYRLVRLAAIPALGVWVVVANLWIYPHYLAFFNLASGGPNNGYRLLADSNLDWGQDLPALAQYLNETFPGEHVYLSYFGQADPTYYGIQAIALPAWPPPPPDLEQPPFYPLRPAAGLYAISASNLVGLQLYEPDSFAYFLQKEPLARVGYSIFVYQVPETTEPLPTWFAQCANPETSLSDPAIVDLTGLDGLRSVYFDCTHSLAFPEGHGWLLLPADVSPLVELGTPDFVARYPDGTLRYRVWLTPTPPPAPVSTVEAPAAPLPLPVADHLEMLGYRVEPETLAPGQTLTLTTWWRVREPPDPPVSIFAHLLYPEGTLASGGDALGLMAEFWQSGTVIIQQHSLALPGEAPSGDYPLQTGLYSLATGQRFPVAQNGDRVIDRILLRMIHVEGS